MSAARPAPTIDRPPLWTALAFEAMRRADAQDHLDGLGVLRALGYAHTRASALELLQRAGRGARLSASEEERLARLATRLTDMWAAWTDAEREAFSAGYLDHERQPLSARPVWVDTYADTPAGLSSPYTPHLYQARAIAFSLAHPRALLALEMGLGKTLIALYTAQELLNRGEVRRVIIAAPKSAHNAWTKHLKMSARASQVLTGATPEKREGAYTRLYNGELELLVITHQTLALDYAYFAKILSTQPALLILDEAHKAKAQDGQIARAFEALAERAARVLGLTGTPAPNRVEDFYLVVDRIAPGALGGYQEFCDRYTYRVYDAWSSTEGASYTAGALRADRLGELYERLKGVLFVRTATDPDARLDLPPRRDLAPRLELDEIQRRILRALAHAQIEREEAPAEYEAALRGERGHLAQIAAEGATANAQALGVRIEQLGISPALFSPTFARLAPHYESPKLALIADQVAAHLSADPTAGAVIFCEYTEGLSLARAALIRRGLAGELIDLYIGETSAKQRAEIEGRLNSGAARVVCGQTRALETGANLQERADYVAHLSTPWSPDTLAQSTARVYRQGQRRAVTVLRPSSTPLEEAKNAALTAKIMRAAALTGALTDADARIIETSADPRKRRAQRALFERGSYDYAMIAELLDLKALNR